MRKLRLLTNLLIALASVFVGGGTLMAEAVITDLEHGGATITSKDSTPPDGALTLRDGQEASPDLFMADIDERITRIRPMATPIDQITRKAGRATKCDSMEVEYYSVGTRPMVGVVATAVAASTTTNRFTLPLVDNSVLDTMDTVRFKGVNGYDAAGNETPGVELVGLVISMSAETGQANVMPINGKNGQTGYPAIPADTEIVRMGRAAAELDVTTAVFSNVPTKETQYCQKFIMQVEMSTLAQMGKKEVDWNFSDLEEDGIYDMRLGMESSFLFGHKAKFKHPVNNGLVYTTGGIYWMIPTKINVGKYVAIEEGGQVVDYELQITDKELVDIAKDLFTGTGVGNRRKIAFAGSEALAAFSKIKSETDKIVVREKVEHWGLTFRSFDTEFGELMFIHHELLDLQGKSDEIVVIDPEFLTKRYHKGWDRTDYDMKKLAQRDTKAVVMTEISCTYLRYYIAHAIMKINGNKPEITEP